MKRKKRILYGAIGIFGFILSLQLLGESTQELAPLLESFFATFMQTDVSALGAGWLMAYLVLNGATSAAIGIALLESGLIELTQVFMVVSGSRLGAAFIVIFIGVLEYLQGKSEDLTDSCSVGILTFLLTYTIYIPAVILGYLLITSFDLGLLETQGPEALKYSLTVVFQPIVDLFTGLIPAALLFGLSVLLLLVSLKQFDKSFQGIGPQKMRDDYIRFFITNKWISFSFGAFLTLVTTSVALSLGIIVPLYNKGYLKREEIIPYILGANVTTMISSIIAAIVMNSTTGMKAVLTLTVTISLTTLIAMIFYRSYYRIIQASFDRIISNHIILLVFVISLLFTPIILLFGF